MEKFGNTRVLVEAVNAEIEKLKILNTDKIFIDLVEKLEKIKIDMEAVDKIEEISNTNTITMIEAKLPSTVKQDWIKEIIREGYEKLSTKNKFFKFFDFLANYKLMAEYETMETPGIKAQTHLFTAPQAGRTGQTGQTGGVKGGEVCNSPHKSKGTGSGSGSSFPLKPCIACSDRVTDEDYLLHSVETFE